MTLLFKDPESDMYVHDNQVLLLRKPAQGYLSLSPSVAGDLGLYGGMNEKGVSFTSTFVPVAENQVSYIRRPYVRLILDASTAKEAVKIIKDLPLMRVISTSQVIQKIPY